MRGWSVDDCGGMHVGVGNGAGKYRGVDCIRGVALPDKMMQSYE